MDLMMKIYDFNLITEIIEFNEVTEFNNKDWLD